MNFDLETIDLGEDGHCYLRSELLMRGDMLRHGITGSERYPDLIIMVVEKFEFRQEDQERPKIDYTAGEYVGVAKEVAMSERIGETFYDSLVMQSASDAKAFWTNDKLRKLFVNELFPKAGVGRVLPGTSRHDRDALRHLLRYMAFKRRQKWLFDALVDFEKE